MHGDEMACLNTVLPPWRLGWPSFAGEAVFLSWALVKLLARPESPPDGLFVLSMSARSALSVTYCFVRRRTKSSRFAVL